MKLKNKKTGEIGTPRVDYQELYVRTESGFTYNYESLEKMCEVWEDYHEEQKSAIKDVWFNNKIANAHFVGIDFISDEEAEKAVEKLKAVKRLKDNGFEFINWEFRDVLDGDLVIKAKLNFNNTSIIQRDLEVCFGGKEWENT